MTMSERNAKIVRLHRHGVALRDIGDQFGISGERVRQIVSRSGSGSGGQPAGHGATANG
jgi:DNA-directed RNA polymerase sigma subunit (sigma70/sigma32)